MASPFDRCITLGITEGKASMESTSSFRPGGPLLLLVNPAGRFYSFSLHNGLLMPPEDVNKILEELGLDVRVDYRGVAYVMESPK
jgi:hypothetical protein